MAMVFVFQDKDAAGIFHLLPEYDKLRRSRVKGSDIHVNTPAVNS